MMARNREQFGFRIIDSPRIPDRKSKPHRGKTAVMAVALTFLFWVVVLGYWDRKNMSKLQANQ